MAISDQLKDAINASGETHYRIGKESGVAAHVIHRWASGEREHLRSDTIDRLCDYFGLVLAAKKPGTKVKQATKKTTTKRKRRKKSSE
ncbi:MAG: hypothetical protein ACE5KM_21050 [Planctomycetaceae bacterium]